MGILEVVNMLLCFYFVFEYTKMHLCTWCVLRGGDSSSLWRWLVSCADIYLQKASYVDAFFFCYQYSNFWLSCYFRCRYVDCFVWFDVETLIIFPTSGPYWGEQNKKMSAPMVVFPLRPHWGSECSMESSGAGSLFALPAPASGIRPHRDLDTSEGAAQLPPVVIDLTHWGRDKMDDISQTTFSNAFSLMKMFEFRLKFHWNLFPMVQSTTL